MEHALSMRPDATVEPGPYGVASGTRIDGKRVGDWQPDELTELPPRKTVEVDEGDLLRLMRNSTHLAMYSLEMVDHSTALINEGTVRMTCDEARCLCRCIQQQIGHGR